MIERAPKTWGFWTEAKLDILRDYLPAFLAASSRKAPVAVYLDAFAGEGKGRSRLTLEEFDGSATIAAGAVATGGSGYSFHHLRFFELSPSRASAIESSFRVQYPGRDIRVVPGDCNATLPAELAAMPPAMRKAPTFAFLDPFGTELHWRTVRALAMHKQPAKFKVELWMLFSAAGLMRIAGTTPQAAAVGAEDILSAIFGGQGWAPIVDARRRDAITGTDAREAFVNLMRWQLEKELGYSATHALEVKNAHGTSVYHMIFATDHPAGDRIIRDLYRKAARALPDMAEEARRFKVGLMSLFDMPAGDAPDYVHEPPSHPADFLAVRASKNGRAGSGQSSV